MSSNWTRTARAAIVVIGISVALGAGVAPSAFASPTACTTPTTGTDPDPVHAGSATPQPEPCDPASDPTSAPTAVPDPVPAAPAPDPVNSGIVPPGSVAPVPAPSETPAAPVVDKGVVFPPSTEAPKPGAGPTASLTTVANAVAIRSRSVSTVVTVPAGLNVANPTEVSILFGFGRRQTQNYDPAAGNRFTFDFDPGDGTARTEDVAVSLTERGAGGSVPFGFVRKVPVEALYDVAISPLTFTLINDCDFTFAGLIPQDSEPTVEWQDDRGEASQSYSMRGGQSRVIDRFARTAGGVTAKDGLTVPRLRFEEADTFPFVPYGFEAVADGGPQPLLPGVTHHVVDSSHSPGDEVCNANFDYTSTVTLQTYSAL